MEVHAVARLPKLQLPVHVQLAVLPDLPLGLVDGIVVVLKMVPEDTLVEGLAALRWALMIARLRSLISHVSDRLIVGLLIKQFVLEILGAVEIRAVGLTGGLRYVWWGIVGSIVI